MEKREFMVLLLGADNVRTIARTFDDEVEAQRWADAANAKHLGARFVVEEMER